ncbi:hypothetical protein ACRAWC_21795 [Leifsonia sp. L25]|uniref:hypothetical protein n=1 Tax=Leifsonia sp. L25 TaxID=3423957 RepID=UPI003D6953AE
MWWSGTYLLRFSRARWMRQSWPWDIETTGLDWRSATIETCQLSFAGEVFVVQLLGNQHPDNLSRLLAAPKVTKLFHHAPFDVRFMTAHWAVRAAERGLHQDRSEDCRPRAAK